MLQKAIQESYFVAIDNLHIPDLSLSQQDMDNIAQLVNTHSDYFWQTAVKLKQRQIEVDTERSRIAAFKNPFDTLAAMIARAAGAVFNAFNTGIKSKLTEVKNTILPETDEFERPDILRSTKLRFMTKHDAKVDPVICEPLDGTEWESDDPDIPDPPVSTHIHCRCTMVPVIEE